MQKQSFAESAQELRDAVYDLLEQIGIKRIADWLADQLGRK